ncbi:hypothetical protein [Streptomyces coryli]|uniref:hypothetical protein n=1 Tax=Streptomyces coryli TaxID=1128680 RepID=UPI0019D1E263|nr:hypothetical protein [Streptomyces coryli]
MRRQRHDFEPAKLIAGLVLLTAAALYAAAATGDLPLPYWWLLPLCVALGLALAGLVAAVTYAAGRTRRRLADAAATHDPIPPPDTLPAMPMDQLRGEYNRLGTDEARSGPGDQPRDGQG